MYRRPKDRTRTRGRGTPVHKFWAQPTAPLVVVPRPGASHDQHDWRTSSCQSTNKRHRAFHAEGAAVGCAGGRSLGLSLVLLGWRLGFVSAGVLGVLGRECRPLGLILLVQGLGSRRWLGPWCLLGLRAARRLPALGAVLGVASGCRLLVGPWVCRVLCICVSVVRVVIGGDSSPGMVHPWFLGGA